MVVLLAWSGVTKGQYTLLQPSTFLMIIQQYSGMMSSSK